MYLRTLSIAPVEERDHGTDGFGWTIIPTIPYYIFNC